MKICFGLFMLVIIACKSPSTIPATLPPDTIHSIDTSYSTKQLVTEESGTPTSFVPGYYTGTIPCENCYNITRKILLLNDHTYHLKDVYNGSQLPPVETTGRWLTTNDHLQLLVNNVVVKRFSVTTKGLSELNMNGALVPINPDNYLSRTIIGADNIAWMEKKNAGIDFFALGNEPFWLMEIDVDKQISFLQVDSSQPTIFTYAPPIKQNEQFIYQVRNNSDSMQITITPQFCTDGMSDNWYEFKVEARYKGLIFSGCGVALAPFGGS